MSTVDESYVRHWSRDVLGAWNRFWFTPADPATLSLIRILAGAMLFYTHLIWSLDLEAFFGPDGWFSISFVRMYQAGGYGWSYFWWLTSPAAMWTAHILALIVFAMFTLGLFSRTTAVLAFIITCSYVGRAPGALFGLDQINRLLAMYLMLGPCGAAYSLDRLWAKRRAGGQLPQAPPSVAANVAIRLIQIHMCIIYFFAAVGKLNGTAWWTGTAMWLAFANYEYQSVDMTWTAHWPLLLNLMTHVTVFWELTYWALIWPRLSRPVMLLLAVPLHMGIAICLGMVTFGLVMLFGNLAFVPPSFVRASIGRLTGKQGRGAEQALSSAAAGATIRRGALSAAGPRRKRH